MQKYSRDFSVGLFVLAGLLCLAYLTVKLGKMELFSNDGTLIKAEFTSVAGLKTGANVEIAGVPVGKVVSIALHKTKPKAVVVLQVKKEVTLTDDSFSFIKTSGLIGDKYVSISIGGGSPIASGGELTETESAVDIEGLISKYVFGGVK